MIKEGEGSKTTPYEGFKYAEDIPPRSYHSYWIEGTDTLIPQGSKAVAEYIAKVLHDTKNVYSVTAHVLLGIHVTTMTEKKES